jgi:hypothetical protein
VGLKVLAVTLTRASRGRLRLTSSIRPAPLPPSPLSAPPAPSGSPRRPQPPLRRRHRGRRPASRDLLSPCPVSSRAKKRHPVERRDDDWEEGPLGHSEGRNAEELEAFRWPATAWDRSPLEKTRWKRSSSGLVVNSSGLGSRVGAWCGLVGV